MELIVIENDEQLESLSILLGKMYLNNELKDRIKIRKSRDNITIAKLNRTGKVIHFVIIDKDGNYPEG